MAVIRRNPRQRRVLAVGVGVLAVVMLGVAAPAAASASSGRRCPDRASSVYDRPAPAEGGGYVLDDGEFLRFGVPGAVSGGPSDVNNRGDIVGPYVDAAGFQHGFRLDRRGCLTRVDYPGPLRSKNEAIGINDRGHIVGGYSTGPVPTTSSAMPSEPTPTGP
jgi:hypothetical protein